MPSRNDNKIILVLCKLREKLKAVFCIPAMLGVELLRPLLAKVQLTGRPQIAGCVLLADDQVMGRSNTPWAPLSYACPLEPRFLLLAGLRTVIG